MEELALKQGSRKALLAIPTTSSRTLAQPVLLAKPNDATASPQGGKVVDQEREQVWKAWLERLETQE